MALAATSFNAALPARKRKSEIPAATKIHPMNRGSISARPGNGLETPPTMATPNAT